MFFKKKSQDLDAQAEIDKDERADNDKSEADESEVDEEKFESDDDNKEEGESKKKKTEISKDAPLKEKIVWFLKTNFVCFVFFGIMLVSSFIGSTMYADIQQEVEEQRQELNNLQNSLKTKSAETKVVKNTVIKSTTGYNAERAATDDEEFRKFMNVVCTWNSYESYNKARNIIISDYGIDENSSFMTQFMPKVGNIVENGKNYNLIDGGNWNMKFDSMKSYVISISSNIYTYFAIVDVVTTSREAKGGEAVSRCVVTYDIDADHKISRISAIPVY